MPGVPDGGGAAPCGGAEGGIGRGADCSAGGGDVGSEDRRRIELEIELVPADSK